MMSKTRYKRVFLKTSIPPLFTYYIDLNALASKRDCLQRAKPLLLLIGGWQTNLKVHLPPPTGLEYGQKKKKKNNLYYLYIYIKSLNLSQYFQIVCVLDIVFLTDFPLSYFVLQLVFLTPLFLLHTFYTLIKCVLLSLVCCSVCINQRCVFLFSVM